MKTTRTTLLAVALVAVLGACSTASGGESSTPPTDADATVTAADMAFAPGTVTVTAGEDFSLALVNQDSMPHNIAIYTDSSRSEKLFEGEMVTDGTIVYDISALEPGEYFFDCSLHPNMTGTLVIQG